MKTFICCTAAVLFALAFAVSDAQAQGQGKKPAAKKCDANFIETCIKNCSARGGQSRLCPQYCQGQKAKMGC